MCLVGVVVRRYIDFLILLIPTLVSALFCCSIPTFCFIFYVFRSCIVYTLSLLLFMSTNFSGFL